MARYKGNNNSRSNDFDDDDCDLSPEIEHYLKKTSRKIKRNKKKLKKFNNEK